MNKVPRPSPVKARLVGPIDVLLILALTLCAVGFIPAMQAASPSTVVIRRDGSIVARYPLNSEVSLTIEGAQGPLAIRIGHGGVAVTHASCRNQICVHTGCIRHPYQEIICAPNHVIIEISSPHPRDSIDAVSQ